MHKALTIQSSSAARYAILVAGAALVAFIASVYLPEGVDWHKTYRPASLALLSGRSPFSEDSFFAPPWAVVPLLPLALLPENLGRGALFVVSLLVFALAAYRLRAALPALTAFLLSPPVMHCLLNANIEWLPLIGFTLPPWLGLFFVTMKPQSGFIVVLFWLVEALRRGGLREAVRTFWPVTLVGLLSLALFGLWPLHLLEYSGRIEGYNASLWPLSIPAGLALAVAALRKREIRFAMGASPCLSPVLLLHGWSGALAAVTVSNVETIAAVVGLWILVLMRGMH